MSQVMEHINRLADAIGPRPATTDAEAEAAEYIESVFRAHNLDVERQEFDSPRSDARAHIVYGVLLIAAAVLSVWWSLPALALAVLATVLVWLDFGMRFSLGRFLGQGPSQNVIARHVPRARRNERLQRVVIVAHYDSAKPSFLSSPGLVRHFALIVKLMQWVPVGVVAWLALTALPFADGWKPWAGYVAIVVSAVWLVPVVAGLQREVLGHATDGANDNASGVAAMLAVMQATVPESAESRTAAPVRRGIEAVIEAGDLDDDVVLDYRPVADARVETPTLMPLDGIDGDDDGWPAVEPAPAARIPLDDEWDFAEVPGSVQPRPACDVPVDMSGPLDLESGWADIGPVRGQGSLDMEIDAALGRTVPGESDSYERPRPEPSSLFGTQETLEDVPVEDMVTRDEPILDAESPDEEASREGRARSRRERRESADDGRGLRDWLGIGRGFDVRRAGKQIGSWENLENDDDEFGFKAGSAGGDITGSLDPTELAARIRRQVTDGVDRALAEKEIWFVATGAGEPGGYGMRALLDAYGDDLKGAAIINIDSVGAGAVSFITHEGVTRRLHADRRLVSQAKRTVREQGSSVRGRERMGASGDAVVALTKGFRAMSVMAFDINDRLPNWHWHTDTVDAVSADTVEQAVDFVSALVRDL